MTQFLEIGIGLAAWAYLIRCAYEGVRRLPDTWLNLRYDFHKHVLCRLGKHSIMRHYLLDTPLQSVSPATPTKAICRYCYREENHDTE